MEEAILWKTGLLRELGREASALAVFWKNGGLRWPRRDCADRSAGWSCR